MTHVWQFTATITKLELITDGHSWGHDKTKRSQLCKEKNTYNTKTSPNRGFCALCLVDYIGLPLIVLLLDSRATNLNSCLLDNNSAGFICKYTSVLLLYYLISSKYCLIINYPKNIQMQYLYGKKLITISPCVSVACLVLRPHHEFLACKRLLRWITVRLLNALVQAFYISFSSVRDIFNSATSKNTSGSSFWFMCKRQQKRIWNDSWKYLDTVAEVRGVWQHYLVTSFLNNPFVKKKLLQLLFVLLIANWSLVGAFCQ